MVTYEQLEQLVGSNNKDLMDFKNIYRAYALDEPKVIEEVKKEHNIVI
jgi:hypothetical protein